MQQIPNSGKADEDVEAFTVVHDINRRARVIEGDLAVLYGHVQIDDDNSPAPENIPASVKGEEDNGTNNPLCSGGNIMEYAVVIKLKGTIQISNFSILAASLPP